MESQVVVYEQQMTAVQVRAQANLIQEVMKSVMKDGTHYGVIPGTQKPSLYKAGSEALLTTFRIAVDPQIEDLSTPDEIRYRVKAYGKHQASGIVVGCGIGECSSSEEKYKWRKAVCDEEFDLTPPDRKRTKFAHGKGGGHYKVQQVRAEIADIANTVLKMAKKRAQIDLTLTATGASDIFTQDIEDMPAELLPQPKKEVKQPTRKESKAAPQEKPPAPTGELITEAQHADLLDKISEVRDGLPRFLKAAKLERLTMLLAADLPDALAWVEGKRAAETAPI